MTSCKEQDSGLRVLSFLRDWDRANKVARARMLQEFLERNAGKTSPELELAFSQAASLFLARITAWMRLTYMFGTYLDLQLKALGVFLSATGNQQYMREFLDVGGVMTLLEILNQDQVKEEEKAEALWLLSIISDTGHLYRELICESYGVKAIAECLAKSSSKETLHKASNLLESLTHGNPKYQDQVYKGLIALLECKNPTAQQLVIHNLRSAQAVVKTTHPAIVEPLLNLLSSFHPEVQHEAIELIKELQQTEVRETLLCSLVALLKPASDGAPKHKILRDTKLLKMTDSLPVFVQQAAAARTLWILAEGKKETSEALIRLGVVQHLIHAMDNKEHANSQIQASLALKHFVRSCQEAEDEVRSEMGSDLFRSFMNSVDLLNMNMDQIQGLGSQSNEGEITEEAEDQNSQP